MVANQECGQSADDTHHTSRCANHFTFSNPNDVRQEYYARARTKTGYEITGKEPQPADRSFELWPEHVQGEDIEKQMNDSSMQKERREKAPVLMSEQNQRRVQCA